MEKRRILMRNAVNLDAELSQHFTHVEIVEPLVMEAILAVDLRSNTLAMLSEDIGLVRKFVNVIHVTIGVILEIGCSIFEKHLGKVRGVP